VDPSDPDHRMRSEWYGEPFDPERFDIAAVNALLVPPPPPPRPPRIKDRARSTPRRPRRSPSSKSARSP
jgi:hypothetical protein